MQPIKVLFVCLGNICRSPIAEGIMNATIKNLNLSDHFEIDSAGTAAYHVDHAPDLRSINVMKNHGIIINHKARKLIKEDLTYYNYVLAMDHLNYEDIMNLSSDKTVDSKRVFLLRTFDNTERTNFDIPDPYYGLDADFEEVFQICKRSIEGFISFLNNQNVITTPSNHNTVL